MKNWIALLAFVSTSALAAECKSVFVYHSFNSCRAVGNNVDASTAEEVVPAKSFSTGWVPGGRSVDSECARLAHRQDNDTHDYAFRGVVTDQREEAPEKDVLGHVTYQYDCTVKIMRYLWASEPNELCGLSDWSYEDVGKPLKDLKGTKPVCLSCDDVAVPQERLACLKDNVENVIVPHAKELSLRGEMLEAVTASINGLIEYEKNYQNLGTDNALLLPSLREQVQKAKADLH
jgi:hypothetical protein